MRRPIAATMILALSLSLIVSGDQLALPGTASAFSLPQSSHRDSGDGKAEADCSDPTREYAPAGAYTDPLTISSAVGTDVGSIAGSMAVENGPHIYFPVVVKPTRIRFPIVFKPRPEFKDLFTKVTISLPQPLEREAGSWCTWGGCSISPRLYHEPLPDGRTLVGWTDSTGKGHVSVVSGNAVERDIPFAGRSIRGLVAHKDGTFAVLLWNPDAKRIWLAKRREGGGELWTRDLTGDDTFPEFWLGDGRLAYGDGLYGAYFTVKSDSGHYGDQLTYVDDRGAIQQGGWGWGCSHSLAQLTSYHPDLDRFVAICASDCYPGKGVFVSSGGRQVYRADGNCGGNVSAQLGQLAPAGGSWKLLFNALDRPCCEGHGIALATIEESYQTRYTWLTHTDGSYERDPVIAYLGIDPAVERYLAGWTTTNDGRYWMGVIDGAGNFLVGPKDVRSLGVSWGNRDNSLRTRSDGTVSWVQGDAGSRRLHLFRFDGSVYLPRDS